MSPRKADGSPRYSAPALDKGLDILELLSSRSEPMGQSEIARALGRTSGEIFRMVSRLEERGYIARGGAGDRYRLTPRLFELAHRHPPTKRLLLIAQPLMHELAARVEQSCHLAVRHRDRALIVAQVDGPGFLGFAVRVGARPLLVESASGIILLAYQDEALRQVWLEGRGIDDSLRATLDRARELGHHEQPSAFIDGITDLSCPVRGHGDHAVAALTIPWLSLRDGMPVEAVRGALREAAARIGTALGSGEE